MANQEKNSRGERHGPWIWYYGPSGRIVDKYYKGEKLSLYIEHNYIDGKLHGLHKQWNNDNTPWREENYLHGNMEGERIEHELTWINIPVNGE